MPIASFCGPSVPTRQVGIPLLATEMIDGNDASGFGSVRITSAAGNSRRKMSNNSSGRATLGGPN
jgi:hypothetical protein